MEELKAKQSSDLLKHESSTAALEAEKARHAAMHKAEIEAIKQQLHELKMKERETQMTHEHRLEAMKAALEAQSSCSREAALTAELQHSKSITDMQTSFQTQITHLTSQLQVSFTYLPLCSIQKINNA